MHRRLFFIFIWLSLMSQGCRRDHNQDSQTPPPSPALSEARLIKLTDSLFEVGENYARHNQPDSSLLTHLKVAEMREKVLPRDERLVSSFRKVAAGYLQDVKYEQADKFLEKARRVAETIPSPDTVLIKIYSGLAGLKVQLRDYPTALSLTQKTLQFVRLHENETSLSIARMYRNLGAISFYKQAYDSAIQHYSTSIRLTNPQDTKELAQINSQVGMAYHARKMDKIALDYFHKALQYILKGTAPDRNEMAKIYVQKAFAHLALGEVDSARYCLDSNLQIRREVFGEKNVNTFGAKYSLGNFYFRTGQYDSAAWYHHSSLISLVKSFDQQKLLSNPTPAADELNTNVILGLVHKAAALKKIVDADPHRAEFLDVSLASYLLADSVFEVFCGNYLSEDAVLAQMEIEYIPYADIVETAVGLYVQRRSSHYLHKILEIMERSRATLLRNALSRAQVYGTAGIPPAIREKENKLIRLRADILQQLTRARQPQKSIDSLYERLLNINSQHTDLQLDLEKSNPNYASIKYGSHTLNLLALRKLLKERNSVLLEYLWSERAIYGLSITADTLKLRVIPVTDTLKMTLESFVQGLRADPKRIQDPRKFRGFRSASQGLYHYLAEDFLQDIRPGTHLIISADGPLATVPFEALVTSPSPDDEVNYKLPYLVLNHPISYTYSSDILLRQSMRPRKGDRLLAYGYAGNRAAPQNRRDEADLPGTEKEVLAIQEVMKNGGNEYRLEGEASENSFKQHAGEFDIVHLAVHGRADTVNALNSRLIFRTEADTVEDGNLYAHELYDLNLEDLDLAVLSACESGIGKQQAGEGVMSIARGFSYAGCPSLVISLWKIDDRTSAEVMSSFYQNASAGNDLDEALALAKINYLSKASEFTSHPYFWSAFLQVGDTRAIESGQITSVWIALLIVLLAFLLIYLVSLKMKNGPLRG